MIRCDLRQVRVADRSDESGYVIKTYLVYYDRDEVGRWRVGGYLPHPVHTNESPKSYKSRLFTMKAIYKGSKLPLLEINLYGELVPFSWVSKTPTLPIYEDEDEDENEVDIDIEGEEE